MVHAALSLVEAFLETLGEYEALVIVCERLARFDYDTSWAQDHFATGGVVEVLDEVDKRVFSRKHLCSDSVERSQILPILVWEGSQAPALSQAQEHRAKTPQRQQQQC